MSRAIARVRLGPLTKCFSIDVIFIRSVHLINRMCHTRRRGKGRLQEDAAPHAMDHGKIVIRAVAENLRNLGTISKSKDLARIPISP